jgi:hypothetical protein
MAVRQDRKKFTMTGGVTGVESDQVHRAAGFCVGEGEVVGGHIPLASDLNLNFPIKY